MTKPIALAADHGGFELKEAVKAHLDELGLEYIDFGTHSTASVDYPDMALPACDAVVSGQCSKALLFCGTVLCALDARRAQVYSAAFDLETHERLMDDDARAVADLAEFVENCKKPLFFVGDGAALCYNKYDNVPGVLCVPPALRNGRAAAVAYVAEQMAQRGEAVLPEALLPDYHRLSQAERERAERLAAEAARTEIPEDTAKGKDQHQ